MAAAVLISVCSFSFSFFFSPSDAAFCKLRQIFRESVSSGEINQKIPSVIFSSSVSTKTSTVYLF
jgi:hypothetical protein